MTTRTELETQHTALEAQTDDAHRAMMSDPKSAEKLATFKRIIYESGQVRRALEQMTGKTIVPDVGSYQHRQIIERDRQLDKMDDDA